MRRNSLFIPVIISLSLMCMASTCTPKRVCTAVNEWNYKSAEMLPEAWDTWRKIYLEADSLVIDELLAKYKLELTDAAIAELVSYFKDATPVADPVAKEFVDEYAADMNKLMSASEKLEKVLSVAAKSMEIIEDASLACQDYDAKKIIAGIISTALALKDVVDLLIELKVPVPETLVAALDKAEEMAAQFKE